MNRHLRQIVALFLLPCLITAPSVSAISAISSLGYSNTFPASRTLLTTQALAVFPVAGFHRLHNHASARISRQIKINFLYGGIFSVIAAVALHALQLPLPKHLPVSIFLPAFLLVRSFYVAYRDEHAPITWDPPDLSTLKISNAYRVGLLMFTWMVYVVTLMFPETASAWLSGDQYNQHWVWGMVLTMMAISMATRSSVVVHRLYQWGEWESTSIRQLHHILFGLSVFTAGVAFAAAIAHFGLQSDLFYDADCIPRNLIASLIFIAWGVGFNTLLEKAVKSPEIQVAPLSESA